MIIFQTTLEKHGVRDSTFFYFLICYGYDHCASESTQVFHPPTLLLPRLIIYINFRILYISINYLEHFFVLFFLFSDEINLWPIYLVGDYYVRTLAVQDAPCQKLGILLLVFYFIFIILFFYLIFFCGRLTLFIYTF